MRGILSIVNQYTGGFMLLLRSLWKNKYYLVLSTVLLTVVTSIWKASPLIAALPQKGFIDYTELFVPFLLILPISFLLYDNFEIELGLVCGVKTVKLLFCKFFSILLYTLIPIGLMIAFYRYEQFVPESQVQIRIPIHVPENFKIHMAFSSFVTVMFFASLFLLTRVVTKNCYAPVGLGILVYTIFNTLNTNIHSGYEDIRTCLYDPFLSNYFMGDKVLTEYYQVGPLWTYNRLLFLALAVVMFAIAYILLRREKLHQGFND